MAWVKAAHGVVNLDDVRLAFVEKGPKGEFRVHLIWRGTGEEAAYRIPDGLELCKALGLEDELRSLGWTPTEAHERRDGEASK